MSSTPHAPNSKLEEIFSAAEQGDRIAAKQFFNAVIDGPLYVPDRYQAKRLSDSPAYPNDLVHILGIRDKERTVVPAFSRPELIEQWCGTPFSFKPMSGHALFDAVPEGWWIELNPGGEQSKELSPWEIDTLRGGEQGIIAVIDELYADSAFEPLKIRPPQEGEYLELHRKLTEYAAAQPEIMQLFLLVEEGLDAEEKATSRALVGAEIAPCSAKRLDQLRTEISALGRSCLIGGDPLRLCTGEQVEGSLMLGVFKGSVPFYVRQQPGIVGRLKSWLKFK